MIDGYTKKQDECANKRFYEFLSEDRKINELVKKDIEIDRLKAELQKVNGVNTSQEKALHKHIVNDSTSGGLKIGDNVKCLCKNSGHKFWSWLFDGEPEIKDIRKTGEHWEIKLKDNWFFENDFKKA